MTKKKILIVDDEIAAARMLGICLEQTGRYETQVVNNSSSAIALAELMLPDLILLDVMMPGMDGGDVAAQLKDHPKLARVPIVFLTAAVKRDEVRAHRGLIGGTPFLAKPVELAEIIECIEGILRGQANHIRGRIVA